MNVKSNRHFFPHNFSFNFFMSSLIGDRPLSDTLLSQHLFHVLYHVCCHFENSMRDLVLQCWATFYLICAQHRTIHDTHSAKFEFEIFFRVYLMNSQCDMMWTNYHWIHTHTHTQFIIFESTALFICQNKTFGTNKDIASIPSMFDSYFILLFRFEFSSFFLISFIADNLKYLSNSMDMFIIPMVALFFLFLLRLSSKWKNEEHLE